MELARNREEEFQSHAGSIEAKPDPHLLGGRDHRFNPTLVRLRPGHASSPSHRPDRFQSHAGSIEARKEIANAFSSTEVSIPRWFD